MQRFIRFLQWAVKNHPWKIIALHVLFIVAAAILAVTRLKIDTTVDGLMSAGDPDVAATFALKREFRNDEVTIVAFDLGHAFTKADLGKVDRITKAIEDLPAVAEVVSLTNVEDVRPDGAGGLDASPLLGDERLAELDDAGLAALRQRVQRHSIYPGNLVSPELDVLALIISFDPPTEGKRNIRAAADQIESLLGAETNGWATYYIAGYPTLEAEADAHVKSDLLTLTPLVFGVMLLVFYTIARRVFSVLLLCTVTFWTTAVAVFYFAVTDTPINVVTSSVPPILLTTSAVYGVFLIGLLQSLQGLKDPAMNVIEIATRPSFLSMTSTVAGFFSLCFINIEAIQEMGMGLALGTLGSFIATLSLLPALVQLVDFKAPPVHWKWVDRVATMGVRMARHPWRVIFAVSALVAICIPGLAKLYIDTDPLDYFRDTSRIVRAHDFVRDRLGGAGMLTVVIRTDQPDGALRPEVAKLAAALNEEALSTPLIDHTLSLLDYNALMDAALRPEEKKPQRILPSQELAAQYLLLYEMGGDPNDLRPYINHDRSALTLRLRLHQFSSTKVLDLGRRLDAVAAQHPKAKAEVKILSSAFLLARSADSISTGLIPGFASTILVVLVTFWFTLGSLKLAIIAIPPNILPYAFCMAIFGYAGIPISIGTSIVGFIAIGLAVDDTAHLLSHLQEGHSMKQVYTEVGMPVLLTAMALGSGFSMLAFSSFQVISIFGLATGITLGSAVLGDLILLPSILRLLGYSIDDVPVSAVVPIEEGVSLAETAGETG